MQIPDFSFEEKIWLQGKARICGIDEVGRGCFAGPVFAGGVVFKKGVTIPNYKNIKINDSKKLNAEHREVASNWIKENALAWAIGSASVSEINRFGIVKAVEIAFRKVIKNLRADFLLIDAFYIPYVKGLSQRSQLAIKKGDSLSLSIAAASIIAKVARDAYMDKLGKLPEFESYLWAKNKGYGTKEHQTAIKKYGITKHHRKMYVETFLSKI